MAFGAELRSARRSAGLSLAELARQVHFSKGYLSKVENEIAPPNQSLAALCDAVLNTDGRLSTLIPDTPARTRATASRARNFLLPAATAHFAGRARELADVCGLLRDEPDVSGPQPTVCAIYGMAGVGKTALAIRAATRMEAHFADGCLFLDLGGHRPDGDPVPPAVALERLLIMLGADGQSIPSAVDDRAARYRDLFRGRRFLLVLDNARNAAQVQPLLPAEPRCRVLVTSRSRLIPLDDARHVPLDVLDSDDASTLFASIAGAGRVEGEPRQVLAEVTDACGRLPLAIRVAAARFRANRTWSLRDLGDRLVDETLVLDELDDGERSVAAAFALSYAGLPDDAKQLFGQLALHPGLDLDVVAAAALAGTTPRGIERGVDPLLDAHLLVQHMANRYRFHNLIHTFAVHGVARLPDEAKERAVDRLIDHYVHTADLADRQVTPHRSRVPLHLTTTPVSMEPFDGPQAAIAWIDRELDNLVTVCRLAEATGRHRRCWQLALVLGGYFYVAKPWEAWADTYKAGLRAAIAMGDRWAEGSLRNRLGVLRIELGDIDRASTHYRRAMTLFRDLGDQHGETTALANNAWVHHYRGDHAGALRDLRIADAAYRRAGQARNAAITLRGIGLIAAEAGQPAAGIRDLEQSLEEFNELDLPFDSAVALSNLGTAYERLGDHDQAASRYRDALVLARTSRSVFEEARAETGLGSVAAALHDLEAARAHWSRALSHYRALRAPQAMTVERRLATLGTDSSQPHGLSVDDRPALDDVDEVD